MNYLIQFLINKIGILFGLNSNLLKNIFGVALNKGGSFILQLITIPLTLELLGKSIYGLWIIIYTLISWVVYLDIGIGNGLRNKCAEKFAANDRISLKKLISNGYIVTFLLCCLITVIFFGINKSVSWEFVLGIEDELEIPLNIIFGYLAPLIFFSLFFNLVNYILIGGLKPGIASSQTAISNLIIFIFLFLFQDFFQNSLSRICYLIGTVPLLTSIGYNIYFFLGQYRDIRPSLRLFNWKDCKSLLNSGGEFFVVQIAFIILFQTDSIIISKLFSSNDVTEFSITNRYLTIPYLICSIIYSPLWSYYTNLKEGKKLNEIRNTLRIATKSTSIFIFIVLLLAIFHKPIISLWLNQEFRFTRALIIVTALLSIISIWNVNFSTFLNGFGVIKPQKYISILAATINIPLSILLGNIIGVEGVVLSSVICLSIGAIIGPILTLKELNNFSRK